VDDYRFLYKLYKSDANQQAVHERFAHIQLWDDREFANDCHQDFHPDDDVAPVTATTPQPALRQAANQAWSEYGLANVTLDPGTELGRLHPGLSQALARQAGRRDRHRRAPLPRGPPCGNNIAGQRYFSVGCPEILDSSRTMLGATQKAWFIDQVTGSTATWKIWVNEVMLMQLKATAVSVDLDQWDGYGEVRKSLLSTFQHANVKNLVAFTGDLHTFADGYLKADFTDIFFSPHGDTGRRRPAQFVCAGQDVRRRAKPARPLHLRPQPPY
jgi:alkaline phosphatase D